MLRGVPKPESCQTSFARPKSFDFQFSSSTALSWITLVYEGVFGAWPPSSSIVAQLCGEIPRYAKAQA